MVYGGVSIVGSYHVENQDSFFVQSLDDGYVLALSDGLGSCTSSKIGSAAICHIVVEEAAKCHCQIDDTDLFLHSVYLKWIKYVYDNGYFADECAATAVFAVCNNHTVWAFRLGDSYMGIKADGKVHALYDPKEDCYPNETDCLYDIFQLDLWQIMKIEYDSLEGIIACSDGVSFANEEKVLSEVIEELCWEYSGQEKELIEADMKRWLPSMEGHDDRTIVFLLSKEKVYGRK